MYFIDENIIFIDDLSYINTSANKVYQGSQTDKHEDLNLSALRYIFPTCFE